MGQHDNGNVNMIHNPSESLSIHLPSSKGSAAIKGVTTSSKSNLRGSWSSSIATFCLDLCTILLELRWRWTMSVIILSYFTSWFAFAVGWYLIVWLHGDTLNVHNEEWRPCIAGIENFTSAFLFSVETQHTTGYGFYQLTEECTSAVFLFCVQSIFGITLEALLVGLVFAKMVKAKKRRRTLVFSKHAVISKRDGILHFMFRVGDKKSTHLLEPKVKAWFVKKRTTLEGEEINYHHSELKLEEKSILFWPFIVSHKITSDSPLSHEDGERMSGFEIVVVLEGVVESMGLNVETRSSYLPEEILWGYRFGNLTSHKAEDGKRIVDYRHFHDVVQTEGEGN